MNTPFRLSVVVPVYNEAAGLAKFHKTLVTAVASCASTYDITYCDDGSTDQTPQIVRDLHASDPNVRLLRLSRHFGKEPALSAGIHAAQGDAVMMLDGDGQHPAELIPQFVQAWREGAQVVVGVRAAQSDRRWFKRVSSRLFYAALNRFVVPKIVPYSTDFRLIDRQVQQAFLALGESNRMTRGLIDWLGFQRTFIQFTPKPRAHGAARYSYRKLFSLAAHGFVSLTSRPLYVFGYLGAAITLVSFMLGVAIGIEQFLLRDPWGWRFTGTALLAIFIVFLVGLVLLSQGVQSVYLAYILNQSKARPLYIIDTSRSVGIKDKAHAK